MLHNKETYRTKRNSDFLMCHFNDWINLGTEFLNDFMLKLDFIIVR